MCKRPVTQTYPIQSARSICRNTSPQLYRGEDSDAAFYEKIAGTLTVLATGGDRK